VLLKSGKEFLPDIAKFQPDMNITCLEGNTTFTKLKSWKKSKTWQKVPFDNAYFLLKPINTLEQIEYLDKNFNST
jgi:hypothetical protein